MSNFWSRHRCLVTGGAGFGGAHLCEQLLAEGAKVYAYDRSLIRGSYYVINGIESKVQFIPGDIQDGMYLKLTLDRFEIDTVFHLAAQPIVPTSNHYPLETLHTNVEGTYAVLDALRLRHGPRRLVFASSGAYYGSTTTDKPIPEEQPSERFTNIYAASKVAADVAVRAYAEVYGLQAAVCRFMNTYGPGDPNFSRLIPRAIRNLLNNAPYEFGDRDDGTTRLDFLHVRDMARAYLAVGERLDQDSIAGQAFNIGTGKAISLLELARLVSKLFDGHIREPIFLGPRKATAVVKYLDTSKARNVLRWSPSVELEQGLSETIKWYRDYGASL